MVRYNSKLKALAHFISGSSNLLFQNNVYKPGGALKLGRTSVIFYTVATTDFFVGTNSTQSPFQVTLADAAELSDGQMIVIKDEGGNASSNNITVAASGSQTIDGKNSVVLESPYAAIQLYCNGVDKYFVFSNFLSDFSYYLYVVVHTINIGQT